MQLLLDNLTAATTTLLYYYCCYYYYYYYYHYCSPRYYWYRCDPPLQRLPSSRRFYPRRSFPEGHFQALPKAAFHRRTHDPRPAASPTAASSVPIVEKKRHTDRKAGTTVV